MRRRKVLWILNHYAVTPNFPGGTRHFNISKELVKKEFNVSVFASSFNFQTRKEMKFSKSDKAIFKEELFQGVRFIWIKTFPYKKNDLRRVINMLSYFFRSIYVGVKLKEKSDVIVGSSVHLMAVLAAYILAWIKKAKFIFEVRDLWPQTLIDLGNYKRNNPFLISMKLLERFLYRKAEKIIILLPKASEYIVKLNIPSKKIIWIPNGVDLTMFKNKADGNITDNHFLLMYIGAHGKANALDVILDAAYIIQERNLEEIRIKFVGDGSEKENLIKRAYEMNLKIVEFCDSVPKERIPKIMQEAKGFIFCLEDAPVFKYGISSNKLWEYMASSTPVLFSCCSINNPIEEAKAGLTVPLRNPQGLAEAIIKFYRISAEEREEMGKRGREYVEKFHNIEKLSEKFIEAVS